MHQILCPLYFSQRNFITANLPIAVAIIWHALFRTSLFQTADAFLILFQISDPFHVHNNVQFRTAYFFMYSTFSICFWCLKYDVHQRTWKHPSLIIIIIICTISRKHVCSTLHIAVNKLYKSLLYNTMFSFNSVSKAFIFILKLQSNLCVALLKFMHI